MDAKPLDVVIRNIDIRLERVEQFLPTLATKDTLGEAVAKLATKHELGEAVAKLATKDELREAVAKLATKDELREAVARLATKDELREAVAQLATKAELREEGDRTRRHFDVVAERLEGQIRFLAEAHHAHRESTDRRFGEVDARLDALGRRVTRLEAKRR
jgi:hypothetical protein